MRKTILYMLLFASTIFAQKLPQSFSFLSTLEVDRDIYIHYNSNLTTVINNKKLIEEIDTHEIRAIKTKIDSKKDEYYYVDYFPGLSADPTFTIYKELPDTTIRIESFSGTDIYMPGNGNIYISGHTNNMYNKRFKYKIDGTDIKEIEQPFYYVGVKSNTTLPIQLYSDTTLTNEIVRIPNNSQVEVLLNKEDLYLVKTSFGLLGWMKIKQYSLYGNSPIEEIYYAGD